MVAAHPKIATRTHARHTVVAFGMSLAFLSYLDRACISQAAPFIMKDLKLTTIQMGYVFSAFGLTYAALEVPSGWLCDRLGPRNVLTRVVICWSLFTAATGGAWNFVSLFIARLLFGAGESGCFPGLAKSFSTWLPVSERPLAEGLKTGCARWGAAVSPPLVVWLYLAIGWRQTFVVFGLIGFVWAFLFHWWYRDQPRDHSGVNAEEREWIESQTARPMVPKSTALGLFLRSRSAWALAIQWFCHYYGFYFYVTWLPTYLLQARGLNLQKSALLSGLPLLTAGLGTLFAGWLLPRLSLRIGPAKARALVSYVAYLGAAVLLLLFTLVADPVAAMMVMALSSFTVELSTPGMWTSAMDMGGSAVGTLSGGMNTLGQLGASIAPTFIAYVLTATGNNWTLTFYVSATIYAAGALCWLVIDPITPLDRPAKS
jgi:sugar phosphate permease